VPDLETRGLQATLDGQAIDLKLAADRPRLAVATALVLDPSATQTVRTTLATAVADSLQGLDVSRDAAAIVSSLDRRGWDQVAFSASADELRRSLDGLVQGAPAQADTFSLDQVAALLRALAASRTTSKCSS